MTMLPDSQYAVQLTGPSELRLNASKPVMFPTGHQILGRVEATGLCFSDLKLLSFFASHARKTPVVSGVPGEVLEGLPSYVPQELPTVPGHECVIRIAAVGDGVSRLKEGERFLIQPDFRALKTQGGSNGAMGYNFEGGLQQYVILDERVMTDPSTGESYLLPVSEALGASAACLVEPWGCIENSYASLERRTLKPQGRLLVWAEAGAAASGIEPLLADAAPASLCWSSETWQGPAGSWRMEPAADLQAIEGSFDDIIYFGADAEVIAQLGRKLSHGGIINIVTGGRRIGRLVAMDIGRIHYHGTRWVGTLSSDAREGYRLIPATTEVRSGDNCVVLGAGGPMGQMHVLRLVSASTPGLRVTAVDVDDERLEALKRVAGHASRDSGAAFSISNSRTNGMPAGYTYFVSLVPVGAIVADAVKNCAVDCLINIFAGIPAGTEQELDLDTIIERRCYLFGTSGSDLRDMQAVLKKLSAGSLNTNFSVAAVSGMAGAIEGLNAVKQRTQLGKIIVYPQLRHVGLIALEDMPSAYPAVAGKMRDGYWTPEAEKEFLKAAAD